MNVWLWFVYPAPALPCDGGPAKLRSSSYQSTVRSLLLFPPFSSCEGSDFTGTTFTIELWISLKSNPFESLFVHFKRPCVRYAFSSGLLLSSTYNYPWPDTFLGRSAKWTVSNMKRSYKFYPQSGLIWCEQGDVHLHFTTESIPTVEFAHLIYLL